ncbi:hypothetical protein GCM10010176_032230 [Nonomuraea spiralis]|nr:hypothetical protein GCM10010176_032230 [Nonomuraea spiralis]
MRLRGLPRRSTSGGRGGRGGVGGRRGPLGGGVSVPRRNTPRSCPRACSGLAPRGPSGREPRAWSVLEVRASDLELRDSSGLEVRDWSGREPRAWPVLEVRDWSGPGPPACVRRGAASSRRVRGLRAPAPGGVSGPSPRRRDRSCGALPRARSSRP